MIHFNFHKYLAKPTLKIKLINISSYPYYHYGYIYHLTYILISYLPIVFTIYNQTSIKKFHCNAIKVLLKLANILF